MESIVIGAIVAGYIATGAAALGPHQMDGYRDTGCDESAQVAVISERTGAVLYYNNATCPMSTGPSDSDLPARAKPEESPDQSAPM